MKARKLSAQTATSRVESVEVRQFLSASVISAIPTQNLTAGQSAPAVTLGSYFRDTVVPAGDSVVEIKTNLPAPNNVIPIELTDSATPQTVANFLRYITSGEYANSIIDRNATDFVLQGGSYYADGSSVNKFDAISSEAATATLQNTIGTLGAALSGSPDSAQESFYFNLANNDGSGTTPNLNDTSDGGPYTTFGKVIYNGLSVVDAIAALPVVDASSINAAWDTLPVQSVSGGNVGPAVERGVGSFTFEEHSTVVGPGPVMAGTTQQAVAAVNPNDTSNDVLISEPASNLVVINPQILPGGLTYTVTSQNANIVTGSVVNGQLVLAPGSTAGSTRITVVATDLGGGTATSRFTVKVGSAVASTGGVTPSLAGSLPASVMPGAALAQKAKLVLKAGASGFTGNASGALLLSTTGDAADSVATVGSVSAKLQLKANQSRALSLTLIKGASASVPAGTYHVLVQSIDSSGTTTVDTGKTVSIAASEAYLSGAFASIPASAKAGVLTNVNFTITNSASSNSVASGLIPFEVETSPNDQASDATVLATGKKHISLKPGQSATISVRVKFRASGSQFLRVSINPKEKGFPADSIFKNNVFAAMTATTVS